MDVDRRDRKRSGLACASLLALLLAGVGPAPAAGTHDGQRAVTACSRHGNGCLTTPVRMSAFGAELRLPSGTWIGCKGDCRETLRQEAIDIWETLQEKAP